MVTKKNNNKFWVKRQQFHLWNSNCCSSSSSLPVGRAHPSSSSTTPCISLSVPFPSSTTPSLSLPHQRHHPSPLSAMPSLSLVNDAVHLPRQLCNLLDTAAQPSLSSPISNFLDFVLNYWLWTVVRCFMFISLVFNLDKEEIGNGISRFAFYFLEPRCGAINPL